MSVSVRTYALNVKSKDTVHWPFDKVYIMKKEDREYIPHFFPASFVLTPSLKLRLSLGSFKLANASTHGHIRQDHQENCFDPPKEAWQLDDFEDDELIVIAIHTSNKGGTLRPTYMTSAAVRHKMNLHQEWYSSAPKSKGRGPPSPVPGFEDHQANLGSMELQIGGRRASPCTLCKKGMAKFLNPEACTLGSTLCLENINTGTAPNTNRH